MAMKTSKRAGLQADCRKNSPELVVSEVPLHPTLFIIRVLEIYPSHTFFVFVFVAYFAILPISIRVNDIVNINMIFIYFQRQ